LGDRVAAYDVHRAQVTGRCESATGIKQFTTLLDQVMRPSRTPRRGESSGSWTTAPRTGTGCELDDLDEFAAQILAFEKHYNAAATRS
jgi:hypothetical protein